MELFTTVLATGIFSTLEHQCTVFITRYMKSLADPGLEKTSGQLFPVKILYLVEGERVFLKPVRGNILDLKGSVKTKDKPIDFQKLRDATRKKVARKIVKGDR